MKFSANLGFLFTEFTLPKAIRAAAETGFDAVECHWPYAVPVEDVKTALSETGLRMLGLNTDRGDIAAGDNGLSAIPGREEEARAAIHQALGYAVGIGTPNVHVMAGFADGPAARQCFIDNLRYACRRAAEKGITILIEPLNPFDAPGYFLNRTEQAADIIEVVGAPNLKLMFDCYHVGRTEGGVIAHLKDLMPLIGHIQFAAVPDRGAPDHGDLDYASVFAEIAALGWEAPLGAEYKPGGDTSKSLGWMANLR